MFIGMTSIQGMGNNDLGPEPVSVAIAAAATLSFCGEWLPDFCRALSQMAPQQFPPVLLPLLRHSSGASLTCRRFLWRKSRTTVALPVFAAAQSGDNCANFANLYTPVIINE